MEGQVVDTLALSGSAVQDLSIWSLFWQADIVVKAVIVLLIAASFWTWAIIFDKTLRLGRLKTKAARFEETFWSGGSLEDLYDRMDGTPGDPLQAVFVSAMREWRRSNARGVRPTDSVKANMRERISRVSATVEATGCSTSSQPASARAAMP